MAKARERLPTIQLVDNNRLNIEDQLKILRDALEQELEKITKRVTDLENAE